MGREEQIIEERIKKIKEIRDEKINPYPSKFDKKFLIKKCLNSKLGIYVKTAGRIMTKRDIGKIIFANLRDGSGDIQLVFKKGETPEKHMNFFKKYIYTGDFVGVSGKTFKTKTDQKSILVDNLKLLTKAILPLPEKFHGLQDEEELLRKRYLDILLNKETKELFEKKAIFWRTIREFLLKKGFIEVETPILENTAGGAAAEPFKTYHNALETNVYLRISTGELWQKKLMVSGYERIFEIGRQFRNEGMDAEHLQDYTQMEFYIAYSDYRDGMRLVEEMYKKISKAVLGTLKFKSGKYSIDLGKKWEIYDYEKLIKDKLGIDIYKDDIIKIRKKLDSLKVPYDKKQGKWRLVDILWKVCRKNIAGPGFLTGQPVELAPLAKKKPEDPRKVEQFQVILAGSEMGNGYSELNDPLDQEERFKEQRKLKESGDIEAQEHDKSFVEALKYGMPPVCGFGLSERLFSIMMNRPIRETVFFPLMKPEK